MIGERLRLLRITLGYKEQTDFAKAFPENKKITQVKISRYENEVNKMNADFLNLLFEMFNLNVNWLLTGQGEMFMNGKKVGEKPKNEPKAITVIKKNTNIDLDKKKFQEEKIRDIVNALDSVTNVKLLDYISAKVVEIIKKHDLNLE